VVAWVIEVWKAYAHRAASYQTQVLLTLVYLVILGPAALLGRLFGAQLLNLSASPGATTWLPRAAPDATLASLRRQF
jgi:hypothetical protein